MLHMQATINKYGISIEDKMQASLLSLFTLKQVLGFKQSLYGSVKLLSKNVKSFAGRNV